MSVTIIDVVHGDARWVVPGDGPREELEEPCYCAMGIHRHGANYHRAIKVFNLDVGLISRVHDEYSKAVQQ